jgi:O-acetylserine/cysteine efflux transporter
LSHVAGIARFAIHNLVWLVLRAREGLKYRREEDTMKPTHILLAVLTSVIWGLSFVATREGVQNFTPAQLTVLRFAIAALPVLFLPRPRMPWRYLLLGGAFWFLGQFTLLFFAFRQGMLPGLASVTQQSNVFFTVLLAALFFREIPSRRQIGGMIVAFTGLFLIALSTGIDLPLIAFLLTVSAAMSWSLGNIVIKHMPKVSMVPFAAWASLVPPLPALALSLCLGEGSIVDAATNASWIGIASVLYLGTLATLGGYAMWGYLLARYPAATVTPFALLVPVSGIFASVIVYGEAFPPLRAGGIALVMAGLAIIVWRGRTAATPPLAQVPPT